MLLLLGFAKDVCGSLLLGQVWYEQLTDKSNAMAYLRQLSKEISQGVSDNNLGLLTGREVS